MRHSHVARLFSRGSFSRRPPPLKRLATVPSVARVPHPRPEPVEGRTRGTKGRGEGGNASEMTDKDRSSAKAPPLGLQRGGGRSFRRTDPPSPTNRVGEDGAPAKLSRNAPDLGLGYSSCTKSTHSGRSHPSRRSRRPKPALRSWRACPPSFWRATCGGTQQCTSCSPQRSASRRVASCSVRNRSQRSSGVPACGSCSRYASEVRRSSEAITGWLAASSTTSLTRKIGSAISGKG